MDIMLVTLKQLLSGRKLIAARLRGGNQATNHLGDCGDEVGKDGNLFCNILCIDDSARRFSWLVVGVCRSHRPEESLSLESGQEVVGGLDCAEAQPTVIV